MSLLLLACGASPHLCDDYIIHASLALLSQEHLAEFSHPAKEELTDEQLDRMEANRKRAVQKRALSRRLL